MYYLGKTFLTEKIILINVIDMNLTLVVEIKIAYLRVLFFLNEKNFLLYEHKKNYQYK